MSLDITMPLFSICAIHCIFLPQNNNIKSQAVSNVSLIEALAIYQICGASIEVKYNFLAGKHEVVGFNKKVLPFVINLFSPNAELSQQSAIEMLQYVKELQKAYFKILQNIGYLHRKAKFQISLDGNDFLINELISGYRIITASDRLKSRFGNSDFFSSLIGVDRHDNQEFFNEEEQIVRRRVTLIQHASNAYNLYRQHISLQNSPGLHILTYDQVATEFKCFLCHVATAACQDVMGQPEEALSNLQKANGHLERGILDMYKDILATIMQTCLIPHGNEHHNDIQAVLKCRIEEFDKIGHHDFTERIKPFEELAYQLFDKHVGPPPRKI